MNAVASPLAIGCQIEAAIERRCGWQVHDLHVEIRNECVVCAAGRPPITSSNSPSRPRWS